MSFKLMDQDGKTVEPQDWLGRPTMVFFGFTWCPDICPTTLSDISGWLEALGPQADQMNTVLISVDPERDTPEILGDYLSNFDPRITGLTGPCPRSRLLRKDFGPHTEKCPQRRAITRWITLQACFCLMPMVVLPISSTIMKTLVTRSRK
ncbi:SCO family protein [Paracoccus marcusii]|uniref:SCO family protein n=1 Tax=Paracoccus marcusii TaxID=59779 RepID=UPI0039C88497